MAPLLVRNLMTEKVLTLGPDDDLAALKDLMDSRHVRHVPIVDEERELVGLVSHRDLLRCVLNERSDIPFSLQRDVLKGMTVAEIMTTDVETVDPECEIGEAASLLLENKFSCLPVVEGSQLVGILTESDFVRYLAKHSSNRVV